MNKFRKSVEDLKMALVPVGETFLQAVTPILEFVGVGVGDATNKPDIPFNLDIFDFKIPFTLLILEELWS